ncbi:sulfatase family protein [Paenibacillus ferrarius]|uniref:sulfatase family protein n=1 Tax=Paenibacillus ferrarius TaxID=1469647 RepID=UPI003D2CE47B
MKRPNLVFVFPDQLRQQSVGFMHGDPVLTPNLDRFSEECLVLNNAVSNFPICSPYRGMLMTGKYPYSTGVIANCNSNRNVYGVYLKKDERCISDVLVENGYETGYIGKWHLDPVEPSQAPHTEGFREDGILWDSYTLPERRHSFSFWHAYGACDNHLDPHYWENGAELSERMRPGVWSVEHETEVAVGYIANEGGAYRDESKPFMLMLSYNPPHPPFEQVPERYLAMYEGMEAGDLLVRPNVTDRTSEAFARLYGGSQQGKAYGEKHVKRYFAAISGVDEHFQRILDAIDAKGIKEDTIVVFTSDHGDMMGSHNLSGKPHWYAESFKVPFAIRYPGRIQPGRADFILNVPDLLPTLLGLMGLEAAVPADVEGENKAAFFYGKQAEGTAGLYVNPFTNMRGLKTERYTFLVHKDYAEKETVLLFDDVADPYQRQEVAGEHPDVVQELRMRLDRELAKTNDIWNR